MKAKTMNILPKEKSLKTVGRPIVPYRKVIDGILCIKNRMPMEDAAQRIRIWFYLSSQVSEVE